MGTDGQKVLTVVELSRLGNIARTKALSPERRKEIARLAAQARWHKKLDAPDPTDPQGPKRGDEDQVLCNLSPAPTLEQSRRPCRPVQPALFEGVALAA